MKKFLSIVLSLFVISNCLAQVSVIKITDLQKTIAGSKTPLIVNFWATYCKPCLEEIPYFQDSVKKYEAEGLQLLLISVDMKDDYKSIPSFITQRKITAPVQWLNENDADYFCPRVDTAWSGGIPASLFINNKTGYRKFFEDQLTPGQLHKEIMAILGKTD
jgi:thiol-disulfide isomerase/thioredoxin